MPLLRRVLVPSTRHMSLLQRLRMVDDKKITLFGREFRDRGWCCHCEGRWSRCNYCRDEGWWVIVYDLTTLPVRL